MMAADVSLPFVGKFGQLDATLDDATKALWISMRSRPVQCYSLELMRELLACVPAATRHPDRVRYVVLGSGTPGVFNFGGDLALFSLLCRAKDEEALVDYGKTCLDCVHQMHEAPADGLVTYALVQGDALGGGLESALAAQVVVAERGAQMGFPEVLFNLFPGMGAWQAVTAKAGPRVAEEMILSGRIYPAEQLHEWGLVDVLAEPGEGAQAVNDHIRKHDSMFTGRRAAYRARRLACPQPAGTFDEVVRYWAQTAIALTDRDRRLMERLVRAQLKKVVGSSREGAVEAVRREAEALALTP